MENVYKFWISFAHNIVVYVVENGWDKLCMLFIVTVSYFYIYYELVFFFICIVNIVQSLHVYLIIKIDCKLKQDRKYDGDFIKVGNKLINFK